MTAIAGKINKAAESGDITAYYGAVYEYSAVGLSAADNPILTQIIVDLLPAMRRIHYVALLNQTRNLSENSEYFQLLTRHMNDRNPDGGEDVMRSYIQNEKKIAIEAIKRL